MAVTGIGIHQTGKTLLWNLTTEVNCIPNEFRANNFAAIYLNKGVVHSLTFHNDININKWSEANKAQNMTSYISPVFYDVVIVLLNTPNCPLCLSQNFLCMSTTSPSCCSPLNTLFLVLKLSLFCLKYPEILPNGAFQRLKCFGGEPQQRIICLLCDYMWHNCQRETQDNMQ